MLQEADFRVRPREKIPKFADSCCFSAEKFWALRDPAGVGVAQTLEGQFARSKQSGHENKKTKNALGRRVSLKCPPVKHWEPFKNQK